MRSPTWNEGLTPHAALEIIINRKRNTSSISSMIKRLVINSNNPSHTIKIIMGEWEVNKHITVITQRIRKPLLKCITHQEEEAISPLDD